MPANPARYGLAKPTEPVIHELPPLQFGGDVIPIRLAVRREEDGVWHGRLIFGPEQGESPRPTAEIFCGLSEADLWQSVHDLRDHHLRDLYRSVSPA